MTEPERDPLVDEQIEYYRVRANEYDDWWLRRGRYSGGPEFDAQWTVDIAQAQSWLRGRAPLGRVAELAAGTGNWTVELETIASEILALDSAPEALAICAQKVTRSTTTLVEADVLRWEPDDQFDVVFFSFWLSHVPASEWETFWRRIDRLLVPGGRVLLIDNLPPATALSTAPSSYSRLIDDDVREDAMVRRRTTADGRTFRVVKRYWSPEALTHDLAPLGWTVNATQTSFAFLCAEVTRRAAHEAQSGGSRASRESKQ